MSPPIIRTPFIETYYGKGRRKEGRAGVQLTWARSGETEKADPPGGRICGICLGWARSYFLVLFPWRAK